MTIEQAVFRFAGVMVLLSVMMTYFIHSHFMWLTVFIGTNLFQYSFTGFCPVALLFKRMGLKSAGAN